MEYDKKIDWQINNNVKTELVKRWVNTQKLRITSTKGNVEIRGDLEFTGKYAGEMDNASTQSFLKTLDLALKGLPNLRSVKWQVTGWQRVGARWVPNEIEQKRAEKLKSL
jgi:hypothetical protein